MAACSDPTYEPGPVSLLDETALEGPLEPPTLTPIAQAYADQTGPWLTVLDTSYAALEAESVLDLGSTLGAIGSNYLQTAGFTGAATPAPAPKVTRTSTADVLTPSVTLTIRVHDATTGAALPSADVTFIGTLQRTADTLTDSQGQASAAVTVGPATVFVAAPGYVTQLISVTLTGDTTVDVALVAAPAASSAGDVIDQATQLDALRGAYASLNNLLDNYRKFTDTSGSF